MRLTATPSRALLVPSSPVWYCPCRGSSGGLAYGKRRGHNGSKKRKHDWQKYAHKDHEELCSDQWISGVATGMGSLRLPRAQVVFNQ
ncbi:unnamed protein product [Calypogeia fissa]